MRLPWPQCNRRHERSSAIGRPATLTIVCSTHHPGRVVASTMGPLRGTADELIIGADERVGNEDLRWYGSVADRVLTYPFAGRDQFRGWIASHACTDWLLFLDGDETLSVGLIEALPSLIADRDVAGYRLRTWWVSPDGRHAIASPPWNPEYHLRLLRNDDRLRFPGRPHSGPETAGPVKRTDEGFIHFALALQDFDARMAKVKKYRSTSLGHLTNGRSTDATFYLPEFATDLRLHELPADDLDRVRTILDGAPGEPPGSVDIHARATIDDIVRTVPHAAFLDIDARARIEVLAAGRHGHAGSRVAAELRVHNLGGRTWPFGSELGPFVRISYHWMCDDRVVVFDGLRTSLTHPVRPGGTIELTVDVEVPDRPYDPTGTWELVFDVVAEGDRWFGAEVSWPFRVLPRPFEELMKVRTAQGLTPLSAALELRVALRLPGELERLVAGILPADDPLVERFARLPELDGIDVDRALLVRIIDEFRSTPPSAIVEFGSGLPTVFVAWLVDQGELSPAEVVSIDHHAGNVATARRLLVALGLESSVRFVQSGWATVIVEGSAYSSFEPEVVADACIFESTTLVVVARPSEIGAVALLPIPTLVRPHLQTSARILVGESWRDDALSVAEEWSGADGIEVLGVAPQGRGVLVVDLAPEPPV